MYSCFHILFYKKNETVYTYKQKLPMCLNKQLLIKLDAAVGTFHEWQINFTDASVLFGYNYCSRLCNDAYIVIISKLKLQQSVRRSVDLMNTPVLFLIASRVIKSIIIGDTLLFILDSAVTTTAHLRTITYYLCILWHVTSKYIPIYFFQEITLIFHTKICFRVNDNNI